MPRQARPAQPEPSAKARATATGSAASAASESVPAAPPHCTGQVASAPSTASSASSTPASHCAALSPNVIGTAYWVRVRPGMTVVAVLVGQPGRARDARRQRGRVDPRERVAAQQHQRGVEHVLAGQPAGARDVRAASSPIAARSASEQRHDRVAAGLAVRRARRDPGPRLGDRRHGLGVVDLGHADTGHRPQPGDLDPQHRGHERGVVRDAVGAIEAGREQVAHAHRGREGQEDRLAVALQPDVEAQVAVVVAHGDQRRAVGLAEPLEERVASVVRAGQVGPGEEPVEQAAGEDRRPRRTARHRVAGPGSTVVNA